jgi:transcriptional regulator with XRE-family HTH domain
MRLSANQIKRLCARRSMTLQALLASIAVSRTAYYSLVRKDSVLPASVRSIAGALGVIPSSILDEDPEITWRVQARVRQARSIVSANPGTLFENVWHTLAVLDDSPVERLRRSLLRGRARDLH